MGTRRSRHNKGRKPLYKEHGENPDKYAPKVCKVCGGPCSWNSKTLTCRPCFAKQEPLKPNLGYRSPCVGVIAPDPRPLTELLVGGWGDWRPNNYRHWTPEDEGVLASLVKGGATPDQAASVLGREPRGIVSRAVERGLSPSSQWRAILPYLTKARKPHAPLLQFPYIAKARPEHADLLRINDLVPKGLPEWMRADVVQAIMLAVLEGKTSIEALGARREGVKWFIRNYYREQAPYQEISVEGRADDDRSYDEIAAASKQAWRDHDGNEARKGWDIINRRAYLPTQVDDVYEGQIERALSIGVGRGEISSRREAIEALESGRFRP